MTQAIYDPSLNMVKAPSAIHGAKKPPNDIEARPEDHLWHTNQKERKKRKLPPSSPRHGGSHINFFNTYLTFLLFSQYFPPSIHNLLSASSLQILSVIDPRNI